MLDKKCILKKLCDELREHPIIQFACKKTGISRAQFYRWIKEDPVFAEEVQKAKQEGLDVMNDFAESKLLTGITNDNLSAIFYWLKHRHPDYSNKLELTTRHEISYTLTDEQKEIIKEALKLSGLSEEEKCSLKDLLTNNKENGKQQ
jgi:hypothetical protein